MNAHVSSILLGVDDIDGSKRPSGQGSRHRAAGALVAGVHAGWQVRTV